MPVSQALQQQIELEISSLSENEMRRPSGSIKDFILEHGRILAQADRDRDALVCANFDWGVKATYNGAYETLLLARGARLGAKLRSPDARDDFDREMEIIRKDRIVLREAASYVVKNCGSRRTAIRYRAIPRGQGKTRTLTGCLDLIAIINEYPLLASRICPCGVKVNAAYLQEVAGRAFALLKMKGIIMVNGVPQNVNVTRQNRLIALCMKHQAVIKEYAHAAFADNLEYYRRYYKDRSRKRKSEEGEMADHI